jgi:beta-lysine 5,6-aminomutase beta subunit
VGREVVVVGAATGTDTHSVGIDAMLNVKGFNGHQGLEAYRGFRVYNLGSQVPNAVLIARAIEVKADAILVSQTVSQQKPHIHNLTHRRLGWASTRWRRSPPGVRARPRQTSG